MVFLTSLPFLPAKAQQVPDSGPQPNQPLEKPVNPGESNQPTPKATVQQPSKERRDDRVYINEIYPEYCRSYFLSRDWVSLFEYQRGMYRCKYGDDLWH
jgi:hypothetical protein